MIDGINEIGGMVESAVEVVEVTLQELLRNNAFC